MRKKQINKFPNTHQGFRSFFSGAAKVGQAHCRADEIGIERTGETTMRSMKQKMLILGSLALTIIACDFAAAQRAMVGPFAGAARYESMPMLSRPNRLGHVYGNTVRRRYDRQMNYSAAPVRQTSYAAAPVRQPTNYGASTYSSGSTPHTTNYAPYYAPVNTTNQTIVAPSDFVAPVQTVAPLQAVAPIQTVAPVGTAPTTTWSPSTGAVQSTNFK